MASQNNEQSDSGRSLTGEENLILKDSTRSHGLEVTQYLRQSDSFLSDDSMEVGSEDPPCSPQRSSTGVYMEQASMEAVRLSTSPPLPTSFLPNHQTETTQQPSSSSLHHATKISPNGRAGRRRSSLQESDDLIVIRDDQVPERTTTETKSNDNVNGSEGQDSICRALPGIAKPPQAFSSPPPPPPPPMMVAPPVVERKAVAAIANSGGATTPGRIADDQVLAYMQNLHILPEKIKHWHENNQVAALLALLDDFCTPSVDVSSVEAVLNDNDMTKEVTLPEQPVILPQKDHPLMRLFQAKSGTPGASSSSSSPVLLHLPINFSQALLRLLVRLLTQESDHDYAASHCFDYISLPLDLHLTHDRRERAQSMHVWDSSARWQCAWPLALPRTTRPALSCMLSLWEGAAAAPPATLTTAPDDAVQRLVAPLGRLLGVIAVAGVTPQALRQMMVLAQSTTLSLFARLVMVKALRYATAGANRRWMEKVPPANVFVFAGKGLSRTIHGLSSWPFRNDFGMSVWFRAEQFDKSAAILLSAKTDDGGGTQVSLEPLDQGMSDACTIAVSVFDSGHSTPGQVVKVSGCVLVPRVWYHIALRHTRSRMKGVFSLATRQHLSIMLDGKIMFSDALAFPRVSDADFKDDSLLQQAGLLRSTSQSSLNLNLCFGSNFIGQTGSLHLFRDNVSDATFRALYDKTGGIGGTLNRQSSNGAFWDARRSDVARKAKNLEARMATEDSDEIVLSFRRKSGSRSISVVQNAFLAVADLAECDDRDDVDFPSELRSSAFASKVYLGWDPSRALNEMGLELHLGAHVFLDGVFVHSSDPPQDVIGSLGGVQSLTALFRSFTAGDCARQIENSSLMEMESMDRSTPLPVLAELILLLNAFVQDSDVNARELLRSGAFNIMEQLLQTINKGRFFPNPLLRDTRRHDGLFITCMDALLKLRSGCSHYTGLETKIFSHLLFNIPLWFGDMKESMTSPLHCVLLPTLSSLTFESPAKVRDCVGIRDMVMLLQQYANVENLIDSDSGTAKSCQDDRYENYKVVLGMIFQVMASGTCDDDLFAFLQLISSTVEVIWEKNLDESMSRMELQQWRMRFAMDCCSELLFLLQIRPLVPGLFESFAKCCGSLQGGVSWMLSAIVNSSDDGVCSIGIRCVAAYLEVTSRGPDFQLSLGFAPSLNPEAGNPQGPETTSRLTSLRVKRIARGLSTAGSRTVELLPSKLTARVVVKLLWHLLKSHRSSHGPKTRAALLAWITDDNGIVSSSLATKEFIGSHLVVSRGDGLPGYVFSTEWASAILAENGSTVGRSLRDSIAIGMILRLIRYLDGDAIDQWIADLSTLARSSRKSLLLLCSIPEWQSCLFQLMAENLDLLRSLRTSMEKDIKVDRRSVDSNVFDWHKNHTDKIASAKNRLDACLGLYSTLLGHLAREGGNRALEAVEDAASLQRVCVNGQEVLMMILSGLCANLIEEGTLVEIGSISAEDWNDVNLEHESLLLKQSAKLVTDAILSNGTKGLDMTMAVRSWRSVRHLTEVVVALVTKCGLGIVELFDYGTQSAAAIDNISGGLHGIRLPDSRANRISAAEYLLYVDVSTAFELECDGVSVTRVRDIDRRFCVALASQVLTLLDAFIFPAALDSSLPVPQMQSLALVRSAEPRLGGSQGPLVSSAIRLSLLLLALLEPCSVKFLECAGRLRSLLYWVLEIIRENAMLEKGSSPAGLEPVMDRLVLAVVLHCHRALGRCSALMTEIESASYINYFSTRESHRKHVRRLLRAALELRDVVTAAFRGRNEVLRRSLSSEAYDSLRSSLEETTEGTSKEVVIRNFLQKNWVVQYQDVETRVDLCIPEQVSMDTIPISSKHELNPLFQGFRAIEDLAQESNGITVDFERALNGSFEHYLESQRKWAETDSVRDLEYEGDMAVKHLSDQFSDDANGWGRHWQRKWTVADLRWRTIERKVVNLWEHAIHWKLPILTDALGRRILLVQSRDFNQHLEASYDQVDGHDQKGADDENDNSQASHDLTDVIRRHAEAFAAQLPEALESLDDESQLHDSDGESYSDLDSQNGGATDSISFVIDAPLSESLALNEGIPDDEWDKIDPRELEHVSLEGDTYGWAKGFIWSDNESIVAHFGNVIMLSLQSYVEGELLLTSDCLYFKQNGEELSVMTKLPLTSSHQRMTEAKRDLRWRLARLTEIHGRRYMLRPQALELFFSDAHEVFLVFPGGPKDRDRLHAKLRNSCKVPMLWSIKSLNPRIAFRKSKITELWKKRRVSNFDYLMTLNRMAGRSFNDITQYPIFPWVLADFASSSIDLNDSRVYRDLNKPIGALNPDRLAQLLERFKDLELFGFSETEKFLYGSHYSSPGIVLHYLLRQEPFTAMSIELQSGRFDCPDRLFFDLAGSWNSCLTSSSDMKELIPEFFCLPEMFQNTNGYPLGRTQGGMQVDDVKLPPWAKTTHEFVRIHRSALESEYVSQNLHSWIDLIFGFKQRGDQAIAAHNLFHPLSYEGSVDLSKIADEVDRQAAESHIQNFGQTPSQLYSAEPHPARYSAEECWKPLIYSIAVPKHLRCYTPSKQFANKSSGYAKGGIIKLNVFSDSIAAVYEDMSIGTYRWTPNSKSARLRMDKLRPISRAELSTSRVGMKRGSAVSIEAMRNALPPINSGTIAFTMGGRIKEELRHKSLFPSARLMTAGETSLASAEISSLMVSCGYWDNTIKVHGVDSLRVLTSDTGGHYGPVSCLAMGNDCGLMVSGGNDGTCRVWVVGYPEMAVSLADGYVKTVLNVRNEDDQILRCCHVLWGHDTSVTAIGLSTEVDVAVSGSKSGLVCVHTLRRGEFVRSFRPPPVAGQSDTGSIEKLAMSSTGSVAIHTTDGGLHAYTVNGVRLCSVDAGDRIHDMLICASGEVLVTGGDRGQILIRTLFNFRLCALLDLSRHGPIRCITLTPDDLNPIPQFMFVGSDDGMITVVDQDPESSLNETGSVTL